MLVFDIKWTQNGIYFILIVWIVRARVTEWNVVGESNRLNRIFSSFFFVIKWIERNTRFDCFSYGISAGIDEPPENCALAKGTCDVQYVSAADATKPCEGEDNPVTSTRRRIRVKLFSLRRKNATVNWRSMKEITEIFRNQCDNIFFILSSSLFFISK